MYDVCLVGDSLSSFFFLLIGDGRSFVPEIVSMAVPVEEEGSMMVMEEALVGEEGGMVVQYRYSRTYIMYRRFSRERLHTSFAFLEIPLQGNIKI
jgi:hypothetical protein